MGDDVKAVEDFCLGLWFDVLVFEDVGEDGFGFCYRDAGVQVFDVQGCLGVVRYWLCVVKILSEVVGVSYVKSMW